MAKHKRRLGWSFDKPQNPLVDIDVSFLVTRETWNDVASKGQLSLLRLSITEESAIPENVNVLVFHGRKTFYNLYHGGKFVGIDVT